MRPTPAVSLPPKELRQRGTSWMKAASNGVPSLSVLEGCWLKGWIEGITDWAIGKVSDWPSGPVGAAASLYDKLEHVIALLFYQRPLEFAEVMHLAIASNGSFS